MRSLYVIKLYYIKLDFDDFVEAVYREMELADGHCNAPDLVV